MIGTFVNTGTILLGSLLGSCIKKGLPDRYQTILYDAMGLSATGLGINAIVQNMPNSNYPVLFIFSLALGGVIGTVLNLDERFKNWTSRYSKTDIGQGLSTAVMLFCIGTLSILGPVESALHGDHTYLFTNAALDFVTSLVLASTYGIGIIFAAFVLFVWQGSIYMLAGQVSVFLTPEFMTELSIVGGFLIFASGLSILKIKSIRTLNLLPALLIPVIWFCMV